MVVERRSPDNLDRHARELAVILFAQYKDGKIW
jgi:hypothetical protein